MNDLFRIDDIKPNDPLKKEKEEAINEAKEWFNSNLNNARGDDDHWRSRGYFTTPTKLETENLVFILEEKKAFVSWFMKTFPEFNVPYDPKKRKGGMKKFYFKNKNAKKGKYAPKYDREWEFEVKPNQLARERDLLFGTNNIEVVTEKNWRERIRDAKTLEGIEDFKSLVKSRWKIDDFVLNCRALIDITCQNMQDLKVTVGMYSNHYESGKKFNEGFFKNSLGRLERKIQNQQAHCWVWGSKAAKVALFHEAGMKYSYLIAYEALKDELENVYYKAKEKVEAKGFYNLWDWKGNSLFTSKKPPNPTPTPAPSPSPNPQPNPSPAPDAPTYSDSDKEEIAPLSETESNQKLEEIKNNVADLAKASENSKSVPSEEKKQKADELIGQMNELEENGSGVSAKIIAELKEQIQELTKQLVEIKKTLRDVLENAKDYAQKLFSYFQKEDIKQITFEEDGSVKVEYESKQPKTLSSQEVDNHQELSALKEKVEQSEQKTLSRQELSQIIGSNSSPASTEKSHWEKYGNYYLIGLGVGLPIIGGLVVYWWMKRKDKKTDSSNY